MKVKVIGREWDIYTHDIMSGYSTLRFQGQVTTGITLEGEEITGPVDISFAITDKEEKINKISMNMHKKNGQCIELEFNETAGGGK